MSSMKWSLWAFAAMSAMAGEQEGVSERGMALLQKPGSAAYSVILQRGGQTAEVPDNFPFQSGDRLSIKINLKRSAYVYVLNRTLAGSADRLEGASRGIALTGTSAAAPARPEQQSLEAQQVTASPYVLVYPPKGHQLLPAGNMTIPPDAQLEMDNQAGLEKLYVVISPQPLTNLRDMVAKLGPGGGAPAQTQQQIRSVLLGMAQNTESAEPPVASRQIRLAPSPNLSPAPVKTGTKPASPAPAARPNAAVAAPVSAQKPYLVELSLLHR